MLNIDELIKESLKAKKTVDLKVYRNLKADIMAFKTQKNAPEYTEESEIKVIQKYAKRLEDSISEFTKAGREDLVNECKEELEVLQSLLPKPVTKEEITECIRLLAIEKNWTFGTEISIPKKEMGTVIRQVKSEFPSADGKIVSEIVKSFLE
jgi:uncharacterized protein YqeY